MREKDMRAEGDGGPAATPAAPWAPRRVTLVNAGPRDARSATAHLLADLAEALPVYARMAGVEAPEVTEGAPSGRGAIVLGCESRADAPPARLLDLLEDPRGTLAPGARVYALCVTGRYEPERALPSLDAIERSCPAHGARWMGGVAVGGGELVLPTAGAPRMGIWRRRRSEAIDRLVVAILSGAETGVVLAHPAVPRWAYRLARRGDRGPEPSA
ncbi:hypothetical protein H6A23_10010 [Olsenella uli]|uniref:hypothetical protein n=1 Tax=Olsenella uli TaxID=133926 RepID=UPI00195BDC20|nr:hypothetical protein [Olsenella uli]MBM6817476.1 hypothetical protein [Olsenella uli]